MIEYRIYAGDDSGGPIDYSTVVATVPGTTWTGPAVNPGSSRRYGVRAYDDATGLDDGNIDATVLIARDPNGVDLGTLPPAPLMAMATPLPGGKVRIDWAWIAPLGTVAIRFDLTVPGQSAPLASSPGGSAGRFAATLTPPSGCTAINVAAVVGATSSLPATVQLPATVPPPSAPQDLTIAAASSPAP